MKPRHPYGVFAVCWLVFFALVPSLCAQEATAPKHTGVPQDWSQRHIVFSRDALALHPDLIYREPRVLHQAMQRWQVPNSDVFHGADRLPTSADKPGPHRDWNVKLGGRIVANMFPAKFSFDPGAPPDCTKDYVVFGLATAGVTGGPANLVAFNNLYSDPVNGGGLCDPPSGPGLGPNVRFAYFITTVARGRISTSPVLSLDGTKIAFVESIPGTSPSAVFHVLTWTGGEGTIGVPAVPKSMTSLTFSPTANSTTSSPWIDYSNDTVYLGADNGVVYKITGVFKGTPTLTRDGFWPVTVSAGSHLTPPVLDSALGMLMVGSTNGNLYRIDTAKDALATLLVGKGTSRGILAAPIVDITNGTTFVVSANDGTSAVLVEIDTASMTLLSKAQIGQGSAGGTKLKLYEPAFSNDYYNDPSTGVIRLCGTGPGATNPWQYSFGFGGVGGRIMNTTASFSQILLTSTTARCTGWTEFFNPNVNGGTDFFFFGLTQDCTTTGGGLLDGCVVALNSDTSIITKTTVPGGPSGISVDNYSTAGQASSIYLTAEILQTAYKFTQNGLQ